MVIISLVVIIYSLFKPFDPVKVYGFSIVPTNVCPGELVSIDADLKIQPGKYTFDVDPLWTNMDNGDLVDEAVATFPVEIPDEQGVNDGSRLMYVAPTEPGHWKFSVRSDVHGRSGILPDTQNLGTLNARELLVVHDCGDAYTYEEYLTERE